MGTLETFGLREAWPRSLHIELPADPLFFTVFASLVAVPSLFFVATIVTTLIVNFGIAFIVQTSALIFCLAWFVPTFIFCIAGAFFITKATRAVFFLLDQVEQRHLPYDKSAHEKLH
ncbi:unnamed protein product, partial [Mesorhabditis spiculigera]